MFKRAITYVILTSLWIATGFTGDKGEKLKGIFEIEGKNGKVILTTDAIYGSYDSYGKIFHYFGKVHMFETKDRADYTKVFSDLCITNNIKVFELTVRNADVERKSKTYLSVFNFRKKNEMNTLNNIFISKNLRSNTKTFEIKTTFNELGLTLTEEAEKVFNQNISFKVVAF